MFTKEAVIATGAALALLAANEVIERREKIVSFIGSKDQQAGEVAESLLDAGAALRDGVKGLVYGFTNPDKVTRRSQQTVQRVRIERDPEDVA